MNHLNKQLSSQRLLWSNIMKTNLISRNLGDQEARNEFNELFDDLVGDVTGSLKKYSDIVRQLEMLLDLEKQTLIIKKKVATFSLDYDDDLVILIF